MTAESSQNYSQRQVSWAEFKPPVHVIAEDLCSRPYSCICGLNNSGKSALLKIVNSSILGPHVLYIGTNRFVTEVDLSRSRPKKAAARPLHVEYISDKINVDGAYSPIEELILGWSDAIRAEVLSICTEVLQEPFEVKLSDPDNMMSDWIVTINGENVQIASTGARLVLRIVCELFAPHVTVVLIDEPELGLSPVLQRRLFSVLTSPHQRAGPLRHIQSIIVASHSHHFLDKERITSNYIVEKQYQSIICRKITTVQELNQLQIDLLGNRLDTYLLPAAIVVVEGKTDVEYIKRVVSFRYSSRNVVVVSSETGIIQRLRAFNQMIGGTQETPYHSRTFVVMDSVHHGVTADQIERAGVRRQNIIEWEGNGIEYVFPKRILADIFRCSEKELLSLSIDNSDEVSINGVTKRKAELAEIITSRLTADSVYPPEMHDKFFRPLDELLT